jgi:hypothetical protein
MWFEAECHECGHVCWRLTPSESVVDGRLTTSFCTKCGRRALFLFEHPVEVAPPTDDPEYGWLREALVAAGLDKP